MKASIAQVLLFAVFVSLFSATIVQIHWYEPGAAVSPSTSEIGYSMFTEYALPFEVISLVLFVAMIGAILIAKKEAVS